MAVEARAADPNAARFAVGELVVVKFSGTIDKIPRHEDRVREDGTITLPLIGDVKAAGKTADQLQREILTLYVPRYHKALASAVEKERFYYVGGQVNVPGRKVYLTPITVLKAIESADGFTDGASRKRVQLFRPDGPDGKTFLIDCVKAAKDGRLDLPVYPGDKINVPMQWAPDIFR